MARNRPLGTASWYCVSYVLIAKKLDTAMQNVSHGLGETTRKTAGTTEGSGTVKSEGGIGGKCRGETFVSSTPTGVQKTQRSRYRLGPGIKALQDIRRYHKRANLLIPRVKFQRLIREILFDIAIAAQSSEVADERVYYHIQRSAMEALQEATEAFVVSFFAEAHLMTIHAKRATIQTKDMRLLKQLMKNLGFMSFD